MFLEIIGFLLSSFLFAVFAAYWFTNDIHPYHLKRKLIRIIIKNWQDSFPIKINPYKPADAKSTEESGIIPSSDEIAIEKPQKIISENANDELIFYGVGDSGIGLYVSIKRYFGNSTEALFHFTAGNGKQYFAKHEIAFASEEEFSIGPLKLELVEPMRIWRIFYNGILRDENEHLFHASLNFLWKPLDCPKDSIRDANPHLISELLAKNGKFGMGLEKLSSIFPPGYSQYGALHGNAKLIKYSLAQKEVEYSAEDIYLFGNRIRHLPNDDKGSSNKFELFGVNEKLGQSFRLVGNEEEWIDGYIFNPDMIHNQIMAIENANPSKFRNEKYFPKYFKIQGKTQIMDFEIHNFVKSSAELSEECDLHLINMTSGGKDIKGLLIQKKNLGKSMQILEGNGISQEILENISKEDILSLNNSQLDCNVEDLVPIIGGKGASLLKIYQISRHSKEFEIAKGFCTTTELFRRTLNLKEIGNIFEKYLPDNLEKACSEIANFIKNSQAEKILEPLLLSQIEKLFGPQKDFKRFAVRSSGVLEDSSELSCAGQNETFLGVSPNDIPKRIVDCWISLFTVQSVRYRLNHSSTALSEMGVVVQEMIDASAAGVLFTADPIDGNPFRLTINGNFGLGESVVSASCDPDEIAIFNNRRESWEELEIISRKLGKKASQIIMNQNGVETQEVPIADKLKEKFCIKDDLALKLAQISLKIEKEFGQLKPIDVEWAINKDGGVVILQARNITSLDAWNDFELIHELDSPLISTQDMYTTANTGEVLPGASSPLSLSLFTKTLDIPVQKGFNSLDKRVTINPYSIRTLAIFRQQLTLNMFQIIYRQVEKEISKKNLAIDLSLFGRQIITPEIHAKAIERFGEMSPIQGIFQLLDILKLTFMSKWIVASSEKKYMQGFGVGLSDDPVIQFGIIHKCIHALADIGETHMDISQVSSMSQFFLLVALCEEKQDQKSNIRTFEDISKILSSCKVESGDIPEGINNIAEKIMIQDREGSFSAKEFSSEEPQSAINRVKSNHAVYDEWKNFMSKHGHRCLGELDIKNQSWSSDPTSFVKLLQSIVRQKLMQVSTGLKVKAKVEEQSMDELLASLNTPTSNGIKKFLKFVIPYAKSAVTNRERTKSMLVFVTDQFKQGFRHLAKILHSKSIIPDEELLFFCTIYEIGQLIRREPCAPRIINKAMRRMKMYPELRKEIIPEKSVGIVKPIKDDIQIALGDTIQATPVSVGKIQGVAKVCLSIDEASENLRKGDILITHSTDIGWSPFFPMLGGIVTELGGLISHGAVVAREYQLPAIVGAINATKIFKTGDEVILDAGKGTLSKVKK